MYLFFFLCVGGGWGRGGAGGGDLANAVQSCAAGLQANRLRGRPATSTPTSFVWSRAVSACRAAHDEVSVGNCPCEASTSQGVMGEGGREDGEGKELTQREMTPWAPPISLSLSLCFSLQSSESCISYEGLL